MNFLKRNHNVNLLIHIVESGSNHLWFIGLVKKISALGTSQTVVTIDKKGELKSTLRKISVPVVSGTQNFRILNILLATFSIHKAASRSPKSFVFAQGHIPSISAYLAFRIFRIEYGIVHHQSPIIFFEELMRARPFRGRVQRSLYLKYILSAKVVQALSLEVSNSLIELGYPASQISLIGHGVDINQYQESRFAQKRINSVEPTILMAGRLSWEKNYIFSFKVFANLVKTQPNLNVLIAGKGPDQFELEKAIREHELENHVKLIGWVPNIMDLMHKSDLFLHLSKTESFGQVILESCLAELPVFCFPVGISLDLHKSGNKFVHIIKSNDAYEIAKEISEYLNTNKKLSNTKSIDRISYEDFSTESVHERMSNMMLKLLEK